MEDITNSYRVVTADVAVFDLVNKVSIFEQGYLLDYGVEQEQTLDFERKLIAYTTTVSIIDKHNEEQLLHFKTISFFELEDFDQHITILPERTFSLTPAVNNSMSKIALGVTRGLMCARLKDTYIANAMLPLLPFEF